MNGPTIRDVQDALTRRDALKRKFMLVRDEWESLDAWRSMDRDAVEEEIWKGVAQNSRRWTIMKSDIAAIDATTVAFMVGDGIDVTAEPKDVTSLFASDNANVLERLGTGVWDYLDAPRAIPLLPKIVMHAVARGHICLKHVWLSPGERGEVREPVELQVGWQIPGRELPVEALYRTTAEGAPAVLFEAVDPAEVYWNLGKNDRVIEVVHEFRVTYSQLCDIYPDVAKREQFQSYASAQGYDTPLTVVDYWNEEINAIAVEGQEYKAPAKHGYGRCPWTIELINPQLRRHGNPETTSWWGQPFSLPVLEHVRSLSWADSISATYMEGLAFALLKHRGIDPRIGASPWIEVNPDTNKPEYIAEFDASPDARVVPLYGAEDLDYLQPPRLVDMLQEFKAARQRDIQLITYAEGILTGVYKLDLSGVSVSQQKQAAMARLGPIQLGIDRACTRALTAVFELYETEWDRVSPIVMEILQGGEPTPVEITREHFASIRKVTVKTRPKVPINPEAEMSFMLQALQYDVFTLRDVQEKAGVKDPTAAIKQRAFEKLALQDPEFIRMLALQRAKEQGYELPGQPPAPAGSAAGPPAAGPMGQPSISAFPGSGSPMGPAMGGMGGGMMGGGGMPPEIEALLAQLPPELRQQFMALSPEEQMQMLAMIQQQMGGGGAPMGGSPAGGPPMGMMAGAGAPMGAF